MPSEELVVKPSLLITISRREYKNYSFLKCLHLGCLSLADITAQSGAVFSPPYLFKADGTAATRPVIGSVSATTVKVGAKLTVSVNTANSKLVLVRIGSVTHSVNSDQRRVPLTSVVVSGSSYTATLPADSGILIPGYYYLFAVSSTGVPSVAKTVRITL